MIFSVCHVVFQGLVQHHTKNNKGGTQLTVDKIYIFESLCDVTRGLVLYNLNAKNGVISPIGFGQMPRHEAD